MKVYVYEYDNTVCIEYSIEIPLPPLLGYVPLNLFGGSYFSLTHLCTWQHCLSFPFPPPNLGSSEPTFTTVRMNTSSTYLATFPFHSFVNAIRTIN